MLAHANRDPQRECCGLLAGSGGLISCIYPAANVAANPAKNYEIAPTEVFALIRTMREEKIEFLGIYHSHPNGSGEPSPTDIDLAYYPDVAYFIAAGRPDITVRAFSINERRVAELKIQVE